jgi:hypothetical protein
MTMTTRNAVEGIAGVGIIGALVFAGLSFIQAKKVLLLSGGLMSPMGGPSHDPPVKIVGGSITFRAATWTPGAGTAVGTYSTAVNDASYIELRRVPTQPGPFAIHAPWQIELDARSPDGTMANSYGTGVYVCSQGPPDATHGCPMLGALGNTIYIGPKDPQGRRVGFSSLFQRPANFDSPGQFVRYKDQTAGCPGNLCEHIWQVSVSYMNAGAVKVVGPYLCPDSECRVYIGQ